MVPTSAEWVPDLQSTNTPNIKPSLVCRISTNPNCIYVCILDSFPGSPTPHSHTHKNPFNSRRILGTRLCTYNIEVFVCWSLWRGLQFCDVDSHHAGVPPSFWWLQGMQCQGPGSHKARGMLVTRGDVLCPSEVSIWASPYELRDHRQSPHNCYCACHHQLSSHYSTVIWWSADLDCSPGLGNCKLNTTQNKCRWTIIKCYTAICLQPLVSYLRRTVMFTVSSCTPYGLVTLQVYMSWWSLDTGSSTKVSDWLLELPTVTLSVIHSIVMTSKPVEHTIDTVSPTVSGVWIELMWIPGGGQ